MKKTKNFFIARAHGVNVVIAIFGDFRQFFAEK
jgi:hypothetical protein